MPINRDEALAAANAIRKALKPACSKIVVAGSLRRLENVVKDIELVVQPVMGGLLEDTPDLPRLEDAIARAINAGLMTWDMNLQRDGPKYKRFRVKTQTGESAVDMFIAGPLNFGCILAIRTGDKVFSEKLVTKVEQGGLMPGNMRQKDGHLLRDGQIVPCPTEAVFFTELGLPVPEPHTRGLAAIAPLRAWQAGREYP